MNFNYGLVQNKVHRHSPAEGLARGALTKFTMGLIGCWNFTLLCAEKIRSKAAPRRSSLHSWDELRKQGSLPEHSYWNVAKGTAKHSYEKLVSIVDYSSQEASFMSCDAKGSVH